MRSCNLYKSSQNQIFLKDIPRMLQRKNTYLFYKNLFSTKYIISQVVIFKSFSKKCKKFKLYNGEIWKFLDKKRIPEF